MLSHSQTPEYRQTVTGGSREILDRVGDKWSLSVIGALRAGPLRFNELKKQVTGISQRMLTLTLRYLERDGLVTRTMFATIPPRVDYALTPLGFKLLKPVCELVEWVQENSAEIEAAQRSFDEQTVPVPLT
ncbi:winged helix-turn-helix transcriptional regulator [Mycoplana rhizolycopersici]|jgi:DNA-binding HxlR family transcriptional regulator|uniref:Helix-turn-helix transcriptional regulator n=1 Tax=Mycoplana rhizolycopersici TaxID=2746702 RepID=A0ABX2QF07_9HYPH|nr:helix-turn-helix domain-containing protein [Rhizobium rhizolycopersici]NVP56315.1 helix-turn-helix transcriptional regulator [Rhizobium rhizolycopersici]